MRSRDRRPAIVGLGRARAAALTLRMPATTAAVRAAVRAMHSPLYSRPQDRCPGRNPDQVALSRAAPRRLDSRQRPGRPAMNRAG